MKKFILIFSIVISFFAGCLWAETISIELREKDGEIFTRERNLTNKVVFIPEFSFRKTHLLTLFVHEDGEVAYISGCPNPQEYKRRAEKKYMDISRVPNYDNEHIMGFSIDPLRFNLSRDGNYFVVSFLNKGTSGPDRFWSSNILSLQVKNKKIVSSKITTKSALPSVVQQVLDNELGKEQ